MIKISQLEQIISELQEWYPYVVFTNATNINGPKVQATINGETYEITVNGLHGRNDIANSISDWFTIKVFMAEKKNVRENQDALQQLGYQHKKCWAVMGEMSGLPSGSYGVVGHLTYDTELEAVLALALSLEVAKLPKVECPKGDKMTKEQLLEFAAKVYPSHLMDGIKYCWVQNNGLLYPVPYHDGYNMVVQQVTIVSKI